MSQQLLLVTKVASVDSYVRKTLQNRDEFEDDPFTVVNLSDIQERFEEWKKEFPEVEPFFAVKAQHNANTLKLLADNGCGFDVASLGELESVVEAGVPAERILYAQPYKQLSHLLYAMERDIISVCDSVDEIEKIGELSARMNLNPRILIRILPDDKESDSQASLSTKFGAPLRILDDLMKAATNHKVTVVGISFHVGSHCHSAEPYLNTLRLSRVWWDRVVGEHGAQLQVLDIGGGYPGEGGPDFKIMTGQINSGIEEHYGDIRRDIRIIAEPGRYMVTSSLSVVTNVIAEKGNTCGVLGRGEDELDSAVQINGAEDVTPESDQEKEPARMVFWGPTCDSSDRLIDGYHVPGIKRGDWIVFPDLGAYCSNIMTTFNGFAHPKMHFVHTDMHGEKIEQFFHR
ncbi:ornithine decarboxylase-like [Bolinopsis microptera]|uniref:ornithine decarboxylase-like n=1 Tax=Bolinopsis microptera TaxID=2820187 RepID=UPI0030795F4E